MTVEIVEEQMVLCRRSKKGPPMRISYEDVRLLPTADLTRELMSYEANDDDHEDEASRDAIAEVERSQDGNDDGNERSN